MPLHLETEARAAYQAIKADSRAKMGACVTVLPDADELQEYLTTLRAAWSQGWCNQPARYPFLQIEQHGMAVRRGRRWTDFNSVLRSAGWSRWPWR